MNDANVDKHEAGGSEHTLEASLAELTSWPEGPGTAWRGAQRRVRLARAVNIGGPIAAVACLAVLFSGVFLPMLAGERRSTAATESRSEAPTDMRSVEGRSVSELAQGGGFIFPGRVSMQRETPDESGASTMPRAVIYTDTVEIRVEDLAASFARASDLVEPALGEFVSASSLVGSDGGATAQLTLRVRSDRRGTVLLAVGELGEVIAQRTLASDVSDRLADLDATLRNERRIEDELLELLGARPDASLEDILLVRRSLGEVREKIERLDAQQASLRQRVALSEVRLTLSAASDDALDDEQGLLGEFTASIDDAWQSGVRGIVATVGFFVRVIVGGAVVWVLLCVAGLVWWRASRSR